MDIHVPEKRAARCVIDTEFDDESDAFVLQPISYGLVSVSDLNKVFYAASSAYDESKAHSFLVWHVLPKLPPMEERIDIPAIREGIKAYFEDVVKQEKANRMRLLYQNGFNDGALLGLTFGGLSKLYKFMQSIGVERTYFEDINTYNKMLGHPELGLPEQQEDKKHHALNDAVHEARRYQALEIIARDRGITLG